LLIINSDEGVNLLGVDWSDSFGLLRQGLSAVDSDTEIINAAQVKGQSPHNTLS